MKEREEIKKIIDNDGLVFSRENCPDEFWEKLLEEVERGTAREHGRNDELEKQQQKGDKYTV